MISKTIGCRGFLYFQTNPSSFSCYANQKGSLNVAYTSKLVGGAMCPSWKMMEFVNGRDYLSHILWKNKSVPNHQAVNYGYGSSRNEKGHPDIPRGDWSQTWTGLAEKMKRCCFRRTLTLGCGPPWVQDLGISVRMIFFGTINKINKEHDGT